MTHPALEQAPKSLREALERIVAYAKKNGLKQLVYADNFTGRCCAIGQFFTPEQIQEIKDAKNRDGNSLNGERIDAVVKRFGEKNIEAMTGMTVEQATAIQIVNDNIGEEKLIGGIQAILKSGYGYIYGVKFDL